MTGWQQRAVFYEAGRVAIRTRDLPDPGPGQVLLRTASLGLCSSDFHIWAGRKPGAEGILGHEGGGTVAAVGPGVQGWSVGDFAVVNPLLECGRCPRCDAGEGHVCPEREIVGYNGRGLLADMVLLEGRSLFPPPARLAPDSAALVEPLACVVHSQDKLGDMAGRSAIVVGAGPMGALHALYARRQGMEPVCLVDTDEQKLQLARGAGVPADAFFIAGRIRSGLRADLSVIATSNRAGHQLAADLCTPGSVLLAFSSILDSPGPLSLRNRLVDVDAVHRSEERVSVHDPSGTVDVVGAIGFDRASFAKAANLLAVENDAASVVTARVGLDDVPNLVARNWRRHLKILVEPRV